MPTIELKHLCVTYLGKKNEQYPALKDISCVFENKQVQTAWNSDEEEWYFSVVDVVAVLTDSANPRKYWSVLKTGLKAEGSEVTTNCSQLKMLAPDGKMRMRDAMKTQDVLRLVQSIPSPKAEPFKMWLAEVTTTTISKQESPTTFSENRSIARRGGKVAGVAKQEHEEATGTKALSPFNATDKSALEVRKYEGEEN